MSEHELIRSPIKSNRQALKMAFRVALLRCSRCGTYVGGNTHYDPETPSQWRCLATQEVQDALSASNRRSVDPEDADDAEGPQNGAHELPDHPTITRTEES